MAPTCPTCGKPLDALALDPETTPFVCRSCARGWWQAELDAQALHDPVTGDFGRATNDVLEASLKERATARARGTCARPDTLPLLSPEALASLPNLQLATGFRNQVQAEQKRRGGKS